MSPVRRVALAGFRDSVESSDRELYPDPDSDLLVECLAAVGVISERVAWDSESVEWSDYSGVVIRSTWDSVDRPSEYLDWIDRISSTTRLANPAAAIAWNFDKSYLRDLEAEGIPTIPTQWVSPGSRWSVPDADFIVKPAIAAGARNTALYSPSSSARAVEHVGSLGTIGQTAMIQPYLRSLEVSGETSIVLIAGQTSHAMLKGAFLRLDEGVIDKPWERATFLGICEPSTRQLAVAAAAFAVAARRTHDELLYARIDVIEDGDEEPIVLEVELIDPLLFLTDAPHAADELARSIKRWLA